MLFLPTDEHRPPEQLRSFFLPMSTVLPSISFFNASMDECSCVQMLPIYGRAFRPARTKVHFSAYLPIQTHFSLSRHPPTFVAPFPILRDTLALLLPYIFLCFDAFQPTRLTVSSTIPTTKPDMLRHAHHIKRHADWGKSVTGCI